MTGWSTGWPTPHYKQPKVKKEHKSLLESYHLGAVEKYALHPVSATVGNLLHDVEDATVGLPYGLYKLATDPQHALPAIAKGEWQQWSPLFMGHPVKFAKQTWEHPLGPLLDVATVLTLGGLAEAKAGYLLAAARGETKAFRLAQSAKRGRSLDTLHNVEMAPAVEPGKIRLYWEGGHQYTTKFDQSKHQFYKDYSPGTVKDFKQQHPLTAGAASAPDRYRLPTPGNKKSLKRAYWTEKSPTFIKPYAANPMTRRFQKGTERLNNKVFGVQRMDRARQLKSENLEFGRRASATAYRLGALFKAGRMLSKHKVPPKVVHDALVPGYDRGMKQHWIPVTLKEGEYIDSSKYYYAVNPRHKQETPLTQATPNGIATWAKEVLPRRGVIDGAKNKNAKNLAHHNGTTYYVVRKADHDSFIEEMVNSMKVLGKLGNDTQKAWKWLVLGTAPRYFVNNAIGNWLMFAMHANPVQSSRAIHRAIQLGLSKREALRAMNGVDREIAKATGIIRDPKTGKLIQDYVTELYADPTRAGFMTYLARERDLNNAEAIAKHGAVKRKVKEVSRDVLFGVTNRVTDEWPRRIVIDNIASSHPLFKQYYAEARTMGKTRAQARQYAGMRSGMNKEVHEWVTRKSEEVFGQYHTFSLTEKHIKNFVPFYGWNRAILQHAKWLTVERPMQALALSKISEHGVDETEKSLGELPAFLRGVIPLGNGPHGRKRIMTTQGLNPYATIPEALRGVSALIRPDDLKTGNPLASQLSPIISGPIQHFSGTNLLTGAKMSPEGGLLPDVLYQIGKSTPQGRLIDSFVRPRGEGTAAKPTLFQGNPQENILGIFGAPIKEMSQARAQQLKHLEEGTREGRKKTYHPPRISWSSSSSSSRSSGLSGLHFTKPKRILPKIT